MTYVEQVQKILRAKDDMFEVVDVKCNVIVIEKISIAHTLSFLVLQDKTLLVKVSGKFDPIEIDAGFEFIKDLKLN